MSATDSIHKTIILKSPRSRIWRALTDTTEFGAWFGARLEGSFLEGTALHGVSTVSSCDGLSFTLFVETVQPETVMAFRWHPQRSLDPEADLTGAPTTLVEFRLAEVEGGTELSVTESGFDGLSAGQRGECFVRNVEGWRAQMVNIESYVHG